MSKKKVIKSINVEINGKTVTIEINDAKDLYLQLEEFFGQKTTFIPSVPTYPFRWHPPSNPYYDDTWLKISPASTPIITTYSMENGT